MLKYFGLICLFSIIFSSSHTIAAQYYNEVNLDLGLYYNYSVYEQDGDKGDYRKIYSNTLLGVSALIEDEDEAQDDSQVLGLQLQYAGAVGVGSPINHNPLFGIGFMINTFFIAGKGENNYDAVWNNSAGLEARLVYFVKISYGYGYSLIGHKVQHEGRSKNVSSFYRFIGVTAEAYRFRITYIYNFPLFTKKLAVRGHYVGFGLSAKW